MERFRDHWKVLIVDDNENFRRLVSTILMSFGIKNVAEAADGQAAMRLLETFTPSLALVDWRLGSMCGDAFIRHVRTSPDSQNPLMPIIVVTGYSHDGLAQQAREAGADDFVAKPISPRLLLGRVVRALQSPKPYVRGGGYLGPDRRRLQKDEIKVERRNSAAQ